MNIVHSHWCCFILNQISCSFVSIAMRWQSMDNLGFDNNVDDWWTTLALITTLMVRRWGFHLSLHYACATAGFKMNLYNKTKHTTFSHRHYGGVQLISATSLLRPSIFGPWVTAIDRFHCTCINCTKIPQNASQLFFLFYFLGLCWSLTNSSIILKWFSIKFI